jgi:hypothetical protein
VNYHVSPRRPACTSSQRPQSAGLCVSSEQMLSNNWNMGADRRQCQGGARVLRIASATTLDAPGLNSTRKSKPSNLLNHWCYGMVESL